MQFCFQIVKVSTTPLGRRAGGNAYLCASFVDPPAKNGGGNLNGGSQRTYSSMFSNCNVACAGYLGSSYLPNWSDLQCLTEIICT